MAEAAPPIDGQRALEAFGSREFGLAWSTHGL
jgi:hypothetical protein